MYGNRQDNEKQKATLRQKFFYKTDKEGNLEEDSDGDPKISATKATATTLASLTATAALISSMYINEERETSVEVLFGKVVNVETTPGLKFKVPFVASRHSYPLSRQSVDIDNENGLRTGDSLLIKGNFSIDYEVDENANIPMLYFDLKDKGGELDNLLAVRGRDAAVQAVEALRTNDLIAGDTDGKGLTKKITERLAEILQKQLTDEGWPIKLKGVFSQGFFLDNVSEKKIAEILQIRLEESKLKLRDANAAKAKETFAAEADAIMNFVAPLQKAGLPAEFIASVTCLKMQQDAGRIGEPFAAGCLAAPPPAGAVVDYGAVRPTAPRGPQPN